MAQLVGVLDTSHALQGDPAGWDARRASRNFRAGVPTDSRDQQLAKYERINAGVARLKEELEALRPDVLVVFGDDQGENYAQDKSLVPSLAVFIGEEFAGRDQSQGRGSPLQKVANDPRLALHILTNLIGGGFDPAFMMCLPNPERGIGHAIMNPLGYFTDYTIPAVPIILNGLFAPQVTAKRAYQLGVAIGKIIEDYPENLRVVAIGSGGLWHTGNSGLQTYLDEQFDLKGLDLLSSGDIAAWAEHFDSYKVALDDLSQDIFHVHSQHPEEQPTLLASLCGPQFGTRETMNWIAASALAEGHPFTIVDYVPVYASPIGIAFAYCDLT